MVTDAVRYCFGPVIEKELNEIVIEWNYHRVRKSSTAEAPGGLPNVLLPETSGTTKQPSVSIWSVNQDFKCLPNSDLVHDAKNVYGYRGNLLVDETFKEFADSVCVEFQVQYPPLSHEDALYMYFIVKDECDSLFMW